MNELSSVEESTVVSNYQPAPRAPAFSVARAPSIDAAALSGTEKKVWEYLTARCGSVVTTESLAREALGRCDDKASILVRHCIFRLRALLGGQRVLLQHLRGHGYRLNGASASLPTA